jgi:hypothetical protein
MPAIAISGAVEGDVDEAVLKRLIGDLECFHGPIYGRKGKGFLRTRVDAYNAAAHFSRWVVLVDLDCDFLCPSGLKNDWLPVPAQMMCFRVVVQSIESWLFADSERFSEYFSVAQVHLPNRPEDEVNPKDTLLNLAMQSRRREIRDDMLPRPGSGRRVGPAYTSRLVGFVSDIDNGWRPLVAASRSKSLQRCLSCMGRLIALP